ncbi:MAG: PmeII family type II restriction endonuclease [Cyclobacteriaceae bacterium]
MKMNKEQLISEIKNYFESEIIEKHQDNLLKKHSRLKNYQINPILVRYLSQLKENGVSAIGIAKALFYPRALGTSISGSFGTKFQNMLIDLGLANPSLIGGMDVQYIDKLDDKEKYCQLKSGPSTINSKDVKPILDEFDRVANLARANRDKELSNNDLVVGIFYGDRTQLSAHYLKIDKRYPVLIGQEFWERLTGFEDFYEKIIFEINNLIADMPSNGVFNEALATLADEIESSRIL